MNLLEVRRVKELIVAYVKPSLMAQGIADYSVSDDLDLRRAGVIDSLGFLQLISAMELRLNRQIDLADLDPALLTKVGPLAAHIANGHRPRLKERARA